MTYPDDNFIFTVVKSFDLDIIQMFYDKGLTNLSVTNWAEETPLEYVQDEENFMYRDIQRYAVINWLKEKKSQ